MGKIYCLMGKSSTGKDSIYQQLFQREELKIKKIIPYTTRPMRQGEVQGREYIFCDEDTVERLNRENKIVELRCYDTVQGLWKYFTVDDGQIDLSKNSYLMVGTLETYLGIRNYFGKEKVCPIYIYVEDGERLIRAIGRERLQPVPQYEEMCRRFLADAKDFSEEKLREAEITTMFENQNPEETIEQVASYMKETMNQ